MADTISYLFPLDNIIDNTIFSNPAVTELSKLSNAKANLDSFRGSFISLGKDDDAQLIFETPIGIEANNTYHFGLFVKPDSNASSFKIMVNETLLAIGSESSLEENKWSHIILAVKNKKIVVYKFNNVVFEQDFDDALVKSFKIFGTVTEKLYNSYSLLSIQEYVNNQNETPNSEPSLQPPIYPNLKYNLELDKSTQNLSIIIDFAQYDSVCISEKSTQCILKGIHGFFKHKIANQKIATTGYSFEINLKDNLEDKKITYELKDILIDDNWAEDQVLLQLELYDFIIEGNKITKDNPIVIDQVVDLEGLIDESRLLTVPLSVNLISNNEFNYIKDYEQYSGQDIILRIENVTNNDIKLHNNFSKFSINLQEHKLLTEDLLQGVNVTATYRQNPISVKFDSKKLYDITIAFQEDIDLQPADYIDLTFANIKVNPSETSLGIFPFYLQSKLLKGYKKGTYKFYLKSNIVTNDHFTGNEVNGKYHGFGTLKYTEDDKQGDYYEGNWENGSKMGYGEGIKTCNWGIYDGEFLNGQFHGFGVLKFNENYIYDSYVGDWRDGALNGWGKRTSKSGDYYEGNWENGSKKGYGKGKETTDLGVYDGEFFNGKKHGYGVLTYNSNDEAERKQYSGQWKDDEENGFGTQTYLDNHTENYKEYRGEFKNGRWHGLAKFTWKDGSFDICNYKENKEVYEYYKNIK